MQNEDRKTLFKHLAAALLILLYAYTAAGKLLDFRLYHAQLYNQSFSHGLADVLLYAIPSLELTAAGLLLFRATRPAGLVLSLALLIVFTGYTGLVLLHWWKNVPCSCGGILSGMSWPEHLVFNLLLMTLNLIAISIQTGRKPGLTNRGS
jgi:putative oxidoreductase